MKLLALVCHHFKRLVYPIIYHVLNFDQSRETNPPTDAVRNPQFVRELVSLRILPDFDLT